MFKDFLGKIDLARSRAEVADGWRRFSHRWVLVRTSGVISLGWLGLVGGAVYRYVKFGTTNLVFCGMITTIGPGFFAFAQQTQVTKLTCNKTAG